MKIETIHNVVLNVLQTNSRARTDDNILYLCVCSEICGTAIMLMPFGSVLKMHKALSLPSYETVRRARQKIQAKHPELRDAETVHNRAIKEQEYIKYARSDL